MKKKYLSNQLLNVKKTGLLPVLDPAENIVPAAKALLASGVRALELTPDAHTAASLLALAREAPAMTAGVHGVDNPSDAASMIEAGAAWIGTPGVCVGVAELCAEKGVDCIPTVSGAGEIAAARALGMHLVRCSAAGKESKDIAALSDALDDVNFILLNVPRAETRRYLNLPCVAALSDRYISRSMILLEDWAGIEAHMTKEMLYMLDFHIGHVGFNTGTRENGQSIADRMELLFGFTQYPSEVNIFTDEKFELLTIPDGPGHHGHIQMLCSSVERGRCFLERLGVEFEETAKYLPQDCPSAVLEASKVFVLPSGDWDTEFSALAPDKYVFLHYLKEQIGDFAFHLGRAFYA